MTTPAASPWPGEPGVPLTPETKGWHWLRRRSHAPTAAFWEPASGESAAEWTGHPGEIGYMPVERAADEWSYLGPCPLPTDLATTARQAEAAGAEMMREAAAKWHDTMAADFSSRVDYFKSSAGARSHCHGVVGAQAAARDFDRLAEMHVEAAKHLRGLPLPSDALALVRAEAVMRPMSDAPKNATEILLVYPPDGINTPKMLVAHWAQDLSGEEQPPFQGWFQASVGDGGRSYSFHEAPKGAIGWFPAPSRDARRAAIRARGDGSDVDAG